MVSIMISLFRKYAEPGYVQIYTKGEGLVEFNSQDEMEHVIRKLDNTKFDGEYIRLIVSVRSQEVSRSVIPCVCPCNTVVVGVFAHTIDRLVELDYAVATNERGCRRQTSRFRTDSSRRRFSSVKLPFRHSTLFLLCNRALEVGQKGVRRL